jgi:hypothetical protein
MSDEIIPKPADLVWARYGDHKHKHKLFFYIGMARPGYILALDADQIPMRDVCTIRKHIEELNVMDETSLTEWLQKYTPRAIKIACRTVKAADFEALRIHNIKQL